MFDYFSFHKSVQGYLHIAKNIPCEDYSESYTDTEKSYVIAAVADGHGDSACQRSNLGSKYAAEIALECLKMFAEDAIIQAGTNDEDLSVFQKLEIDKYQGKVIKQLTDAILSKWYSAVDTDIAAHPLTDEELSKAGTYEDAYKKGNKLEHVYGTTLIAALIVSDFLILIQQGDGRCDVFYDDGTVDQPIPWDDRCFENVTTSLCDTDASDKIRHCVIDLRQKSVIACFIGSDGIEDSYRTMEGTHAFYRDLACKIIDNGKDKIEKYLEKALPEFSEVGSGDDMSVAAIIDVESLNKHKESYIIKNEQYSLSEKMSVIESKIVSMTRKHGYLFRCMNESRGKLNEQAVILKKAMDNKNESQKYVDDLMNKVKILQDSFMSMQTEYVEYDKVYQNYKSELNKLKEEYSAIGSKAIIG